MELDPELQQFCLLVGLAFGAVFLIALGAKLAEVYRARNWPVTTGTIVESKARTRRHEADEEGHEYQSEPLVKYAYQVAGKDYRGTRVGFAERIGGSDVLPTLARYPVGKKVPVYYKPANPQQAVLERDLPAIVYVGVAILILLIVGAALVFPFGLAGAINVLAPLLPHPDRAPAVTLLSAMGLFALLMWYALQKQVWAANAWSATKGKVLVADVESFQKWDDSGSSHRLTTMFRPSVVYSFEVNGQQFISDHMTHGGTLSGGVGGRALGFVSEQAAKYPVGSEVTVYYNAQNPTESVLERTAAGTPFLLAIVAALWTLAAVIALS